MSETLDAPVLVLADLDGALPAGPALELVTAARTLTAGDVVALVLGPVEAAASAALAAALHVPALTLASSLEAGAEGITVTRATGALKEVLSAPLPALVSVTDQANEPRYPNFAAMRAARRKPVDAWDLGDLGIEPRGAAVAVVEAEERPARQAGIIRTDAGEAGRELAAWLVDGGLV